MAHAPLPCRLCSHVGLVSVLDLGATPPCESFLAPDQLDAPEPTYPLHLRICPECLLLQIPALITPEETFTDYAYFASYSDSWVEHARCFVDDAVGRLSLGRDSFVVEVAANDGYLLRHVVARDIPCLGIEPSVNVSEAAAAQGIDMVVDFLTPALADSVVAEHGPADLVVANNVYAHIPDLLGFTAALRRLVADDGSVSIEVHHALHLVADAQFDTIYHEHFQYYTVLSAQRALATAGLVLVDVEALPTHGGSIRLWSQPAESSPSVRPSVAALLAEEEAAGLHALAGYAGLADRVGTIRDDLVAYLIDCRRRGLRVVGYGAPGKGSTLLNYCGIRSDLIEFLVDRNPYKHGRSTPGTRIPVRPVDALLEAEPDVVVVLPWNLQAEISAQLGATLPRPTSVVVPLPRLTETVVGALEPAGQGSAS